MRLCIDWRQFNFLLVVDSYGQGDVQSMFSRLKGKRRFAQIDLASGFYRMLVADIENTKLPYVTPTASYGSSTGRVSVKPSYHQHPLE